MIKALAVEQSIAAGAMPESNPNDATRDAPTPVPFPEWWDRFVEDKLVVTREWGASRRPELLATSRLWLWLVGKDCEQVTAGDVARMRSLYLRLPKDYHRRPYTKADPERLVMEAGAQNPDYERVAPRTFNKHLSTLKSFFEWLKVQCALPSDFGEPFGASP